jgi:hypothetical protein
LPSPLHTVGSGVTVSTNAKPPKRKKWPLILGGIGLFAAGMVVGSATSNQDEPDTIATEEPEDSDSPATVPLSTTAASNRVASPITSPTTQPPSTEAPAPTTTVAPVPTPAPTPAEPSLTPSQENAIRSAQQYLDLTAFSRLGLIAQLEYEQFPTADATFAVDNLNVDWNEQAAKSAQQYLDLTAFSCQGLIEQLEYEQYTAEQARYGATHVGLC